MKYNFKTKPFAHQKEAMRRAYKQSSFAFLMEMGTGKTKVAIDEMSCYFQMGLIEKVLVIAPKGVYLNWSRREIFEHMPEDLLAQTTITEWHASFGSKANKQNIEKMLSGVDSHKLQIFVVNVEALSKPNGDAAKCVKKFCQNGVVYCVVDESTRIKNPSAKRTKTVIEIGEACEYKRILTGSALTNSPLDVYSQFDFLGHRLLGHGSYFSFRARYAVTRKIQQGGRQATIVVAYRNLEDLRDKVQQYSYRTTKKECLDLPDKLWERREVELTPEQKKMYKELGRFFVTQLDSGEMISASIKIAQLIKLQQIVCGHITDDDGEEQVIPSNRLTALMELLEETEGKVVIWSRFVRNIKEISTEIRKKYGEESVVEFWGGVSQKDREIARTRFMEEDSCKYMISNQQTGAFGNTWTSAATVIYYSNHNDLELREQSEDRCHRIGQKNNVLYIDLVAPGTIDERIITALRNKINIATIVNGDEYRKWLQ